MLPAFLAQGIARFRTPDYLCVNSAVEMRLTPAILLVTLTLIFASQIVYAQHYSLLIKGGRVVDPKDNIDTEMDVAIDKGRISAIAHDINPINADKVVDARGLYIVPGMIDIHTHVFHGIKNGDNLCNGSASAIADSFSFRSGVTTIVDAGSSGWRNFPIFKRNVIDKSKTRIYAFLNIEGFGMRGEPFEQDTTDMDPEMAASIAKKYRQDIVGIKIAHFEESEWLALDSAEKAGRLASLPVMVDFGSSSRPLSLKTLCTRHLRPGDIFTHCFAEVRGRESIVDTATKKIAPYLQLARKKGIDFDVGYGKISFDFSQALPAVHTGFYPSSISTDMQSPERGDTVKNLLNIMSRFLAMGMPLREIIASCTMNPAREIRHEELGGIAPGTVADLAILELEKGKFSFFDRRRQMVQGDERFRCRMTIRQGEIVYRERRSD